MVSYAETSDVQQKLTSEEVEGVRCLREGLPYRAIYTKIDMKKFLNYIFTFNFLWQSIAPLYINIRLCHLFQGSVRGREVLKTPMSLAILGGRLDLVRMIAGNVHYTPHKFDVYVALQRGPSIILKIILSLSRNLIHGRWGNFGASMILARCAKSVYLNNANEIDNFEEKIRMCILLGVNFHEVSHLSGCTTFMKFIDSLGSNRILDAISSSMCHNQLNYLNNYGKTALYYAIKNQRLELCKTLINKGCIADNIYNGVIPLYSKCSYYKLINVKWDCVLSQMELLIILMKLNTPFYVDTMFFFYKYRNRYLINVIKETGILIHFDKDYKETLDKEQHLAIKENMSSLKEIICRPRSLVSLSRTIVLSTLKCNTSIFNTLHEDNLQKCIPKPVMDYLNFSDMDILYQYVYDASQQSNLIGWQEPQPPYEHYYGEYVDMCISSDEEYDDD